MIDTTALKDEIVQELKIELESDQSFSEALLEVKVKNVIRELIMKRNYIVTDMEDEDILEDLENYHSVIVNVARYDYNQIGIEGESSHSENGVARTYHSRDTLFKGVHAFVKVLS